MYDCDYNCDVTPPFVGWIGIMPRGGNICPGFLLPDEPIDP